MLSHRAEILKSWEHKLDVLVKYSEALPVLDKGHVRLVDLMGDDLAIVQAARTSYGLGRSTHQVLVREGLGLSVNEWRARPEARCEVCQETYRSTSNVEHCTLGDRRLIRYLTRNKHTTPLEMCEIKLHVKLPIYVARQFIRHRTANVNEYSMRYSPAIEDFHLIAPDGWRREGGANKQGSLSDTVARVHGEQMTERSAQAHREALEDYKSKVLFGTAKELARCDLLLSMYTEWYWKIDLHNLLHFVALRVDSHAQKEIQDYGWATAKIVKDWVPYAWEAFEDYRLAATSFSRQESDLLRAMLAGEVLPGWHHHPEDRKQVFSRYGIESVRERKAFLLTLGLANTAS